MEIDRNGLEILDRDRCLELLSAATLGRIGISSGALPKVLPVNYLYDESREEVLIRTGTGSKLEAAASNAVVAFEVDGIDPIYQSGWSVVITGMARTVPLDRLDRRQAASIPRWAPEGNGRVIAISTELVSGRRIPAGHPHLPQGRG